MEIENGDDDGGHREEKGRPGKRMSRGRRKSFLDQLFDNRFFDHRFTSYSCWDRLDRNGLLEYGYHFDYRLHGLFQNLASSHLGNDFLHRHRCRCGYLFDNCLLHFNNGFRHFKGLVRLSTKINIFIKYRIFEKKNRLKFN